MEYKILNRKTGKHEGETTYTLKDAIREISRPEFKDDWYVIEDYNLEMYDHIGLTIPPVYVGKPESDDRTGDDPSSKQYYDRVLRGGGTRFGKIPSIRVSLASAPRALSTLQGDNFFKDKIQNVGSDVFVSNDKARLYEFYQTLLQMNEEVIEQNIADDEGMLEEDDDMKGKGDMYGKGTRLKKHLSPQEYSLIRGTPNAKLYVYDSNAHLYNLYDEKIDKKKLERFMANFPDDAKSWAQATDEMRDLARRTREAYNELVIDVVEGDPGYVEGLDFRSFKSPSEWNTKSKAFIREMWVKLTPYAKQNVIEWIDDINEVNPTMRGKGDRINSKLPAPRVMDKLAEIAKKLDATLDTFQLWSGAAMLTAEYPRKLAEEGIASGMLYVMSPQAVGIKAMVRKHGVVMGDGGAYGAGDKIPSGQITDEEMSSIRTAVRNNMGGGVDFTTLKTALQSATKEEINEALKSMRKMYDNMNGRDIRNFEFTIRELMEKYGKMRGKGDRINSKLPAPRVMDKLAEIAKKHLFIDTLETRSSDRLDFHEVSVWGVKDALVDAYYAGSYQLGGAPMKGAGAKIDGLNGYYLNKGQIILELSPDAVGDPISGKTTRSVLYRYEIQRFEYCTECGEAPDFVAVVKEFTLTEGKPTPEFKITLRDLQNRVHNGTYKLEGKVYENHRDRMLLIAESELIIKNLHCDGCAERDKEIYRLAAELDDHKNMLTGTREEVEHLKSENTKLAAQFENQKRGHDDTLAGVGALMHGRGNRIPNNYDGKTAEDVWDAWTTDQKTHFILDHKSKFKKSNLDKLTSSGVVKMKFKNLPDDFKSVIQEHVFGGQYGDGKRIENQYEGMDPWSVWDAWTKEQKLHFLKDHFPAQGLRTVEREELRKWRNNMASYSASEAKNELNKDTTDEILSKLAPHIHEGQYGGGKRIHIKKIEDQIIKDSHEISKKYPFRENETTFLNAAHNFEQSAVTKLHEAFMNDGQNEVDAERLAIERVNELRSKMYGSGAKMKGGGESIGVDVNVVATDDFSEIKKSAKKHGGKFISAQSGAPGMKMLSFNFNKREDAEKFKSHIEGEFYKIEDIDISEMKGGGALIAGVALGFLTNRLYDYYKDHKVEQKVDNTLKGSGTPVAGKGAMFLSSEQYAKIRKTKKANKYEWDADKQLYRQKGYSSSSGAKVRKPRATSHWNVETKDGKRVTVISSTRPMKNWTRATIDADGGKVVVIAKTLGRA